jgi:alpha-L-arabinofuranosidase
MDVNVCTGARIFIKAVNTDVERALHTSIALTGATIAPLTTIETINADSMRAANSFESPDAVSLGKDVSWGDHLLSLICLAIQFR